MIWNYRVIHHDKSDYPDFAIHEVFYDKGGKVESWTLNPVDASGGSKTEVIRVLEMMLKDTNKYPILVESQLEEAIRDKI
jgi:hypothetical protein